MYGITTINEQPSYNQLIINACQTQSKQKQKANESKKRTKAKSERKFNKPKNYI